MADADCQYFGVLIKRGGGRQRTTKASEYKAVRYNGRCPNRLSVAASAAETDVRRLPWDMWYVAPVLI